ncbi:hypothetical protein N2152v2_006385 [Parachlorella kessleri]
MVAGMSRKAQAGGETAEGQPAASEPRHTGGPASSALAQRAPPRRSGRSLGPSATANTGRVTPPLAGPKWASNPAKPQAKPVAHSGRGPGRQRSHSATPGPLPVAAKVAGTGGAVGKRGSAAAPAEEGSKVPNPGPPRKKSKLSAKAEEGAAAANRYGAAGGSSKGKRSLQGKGNVRFKDPSEEGQKVESDTDSESSSDEEGSGDESDSEEDVADQTVYEPPPEANVPPETTVDAPGGLAVTISTKAVGELLAAWNILRGFSWQLRLSPTSFADFCAAMASPLPTTLIDEVHLCVLRALAVDETPAEREEHALDLALLDAMTWPCFLWEWLRLTEDPLSRHEWSHRASHGQHAAEADGMEAGAAGAAQGAQASPRVACAPLPDMAAMDTELAAAARVACTRDTSDEGRTAAGRDSPPTMPPTASSKAVLKGYFTARPQPRPGQQDYYGLPLEAKAAILSRLCDHLLDCPTIRAEIDRREREGQWVAGQGGQGGAFPILTPEQRKKAEKKAETDANADCCVLCGAGGSLICCDGCPAAYHMRCLGLNAKSLGEGDWLCPECAVGGRGEAAGLRIPAAARGRHRQAYFSMHGMLVRCGLPTVKSRGKHAQEVEESVPMALFQGEAADAELAQHAQRIRSADELPHPSSFEALKGSPPDANTEGPSGPEGYVNRYKNGWAAATNHIRTTVEELRRAKGKKGSYVPTGTSGLLPVQELPAPLTLSKFHKCHTCLNPSLRKGCLNPVVRPDEEGGADASKLSFLVAWARKVERDFWQLLEGPWAEGSGRGMAHKNAWLASVRSATTVEQLAKAVVALEAALRPVALAPDWRVGESAGADARTPAASQAVSRVVSMADLASGAGGEDACGAAAGKVPDTTTKGEPQDTPQPPRPLAGKAADPYDLKNDTAVLRGMWEIDRRSHAAQVAGVNRLPKALLRKAARQAGWQPINGIKYRRFKWALASPRLAWVAATEAASTAAQLAVCLRQLDAVLQASALGLLGAALLFGPGWDSVNRPKSDAETPFYQAALLGKRPAGGDGALPGAFEYLLQMQAPSTPDPGQQPSGAGLGGPQRLGLMPSQQAQQQDQKPGLPGPMVGQLSSQVVGTTPLLPGPFMMPVPLLAQQQQQHGQQAGRLGSLTGPVGFLQQHTPQGTISGLSPNPGLAGLGRFPLPGGLKRTGGSVGLVPTQLPKPSLGITASRLLPEQPTASGVAQAAQAAGRTQVRLRDVLQQARAASQEPQPQGQTRQQQQLQQQQQQQQQDDEDNTGPQRPPRQPAGSRCGGGGPAPMARNETATQQQQQVEEAEARQRQQQQQEMQQHPEHGGQGGAQPHGPAASEPQPAAVAAQPPGATPSDVAMEDVETAAAASEDLDAELYDSEDIDHLELQQDGPAAPANGANSAGAPVAAPAAAIVTAAEVGDGQQATAAGRSRVPLYALEAMTLAARAAPAAATATGAATTSCRTSPSTTPESRLTGRARSSTAAAPASSAPTPPLSTAAAGSELASLGGVDQEAGPSGQQSGKRGGKVRRCGVCKSCLNPTAKQACLQLRAEREAQQAQHAEEAAARLKEELRKLEDPAHLARLVTTSAFMAALAAAGEEELQAPDAPAAMAAKLRARLSSISGPLGSASKGLASAVKKEQAEDRTQALGLGRALSSSRLSSLPAGGPAADLVPKLEQEPTVVLPGGAALPLKVALASNQPAWVHERYLPLWLIKAYEEKVRREGANAAAKEAAAAARNQQQAVIGDVETARSAARAAAAAAADACAVCGALQGESEELDALWISCDHCERWFHGGCVGICQADVDAIGAGQPWACPGCWDTLRRRERASRRQQAKHAEQGAAAAAVRPAASQQPSEGQGAEGVEGGGARRGRPPKPFWQKADYQRKEQQALERIRRQAHREAVAAGLAPPAEPGGTDAAGLGGRKRRRSEAEQPGGERGGEDVQPSRDNEVQSLAKEAGEPAEEEEEGEEEEVVYCPLCKLPDYGRDLVECDTCQQWYHPECAGLTLEEVEALPRWACAGCQGKRMRAPSQAAILAAIESAREREDTAGPEAEEGDEDRAGEEEEEEEGPGGLAARPRKRPRWSGTAAAAAAAGRVGGGPARGAGTGGDARAAAGAPPWVATALHILARLMDLPSAEEFLKPVPRSVEGYRAVIKRPMDLGTVRLKLEQGKYASPQDTLEDTRLVWDNCSAFNEEGSEIVAAAGETQAALEAAWAAAGLPGGPFEAWPARQPGLQSKAQADPRVDEWIQQQRAARRQEAQQAAVATAGEAATSSRPPRAARRSAAGRELLASLQAPSPRKEGPGGGQGAAAQAAGASSVEMAAGVAAPAAAVTGGGAAGVGSRRLRLKQLAAPRAPQVESASEAAEKSQHARQARPPEQGQQQQQQQQPPGGKDRGRRVPVPDWPAHAGKVLKAVMRLRDAESFLLPVPRNYPGYHQVVKHPMDLGTVAKKLQQGKYQDPAQVKADVDLVWSNCRLFNDESAPVLAACAVVEAAFNKQWKSAGIYHPAAATSVEGAEAAAAMREGLGLRGVAEKRAGAGAQHGSGVSGGSKSHKGQYDWKAAARAVLYRLQLQKSARWFQEPVRPEEAPDYEELVQQPMDFGTISRKLASDKYASPRDLLADVRLHEKHSGGQGTGPGRGQEKSSQGMLLAVGLLAVQQEHCSSHHGGLLAPGAAAQEVVWGGKLGPAAAPAGRV